MRGSGLLGNLKTSRSMWVGNRTVRHGRIRVRAEGSNCNFEAAACTLGSLSVVVVWREEFVTVWPRVTAFLDCSFRRKVGGALIPSSRGADIRPINRFSDPIQWIFFGWGDKDEDLIFVQGASLPGQLAQQWKLRMTVQGAALREVANRRNTQAAGA